MGVELSGGRYPMAVPPDCTMFPSVSTRTFAVMGPMLDVKPPCVSLDVLSTRHRSEDVVRVKAGGRRPGRECGRQEVQASRREGVADSGRRSRMRPVVSVDKIDGEYAFGL